MSAPVDERPAEAPREHPPLRLRGRRSFLLPDLRPPTLDEIRWLSQRRREKRAAAAAAPKTRTKRPPVDAPEQEPAAPAPVDATPLELPAVPPVELPPVELPPVELLAPPLEPSSPPRPAPSWQTELRQAERWQPPVLADVIATRLPPVADKPSVQDAIEDEPPVEEAAEAPAAEPPLLAAPEPIVEETDDLDELDTELGLDLDFRPVPAMLRDWYAPTPRQEPAGDEGAVDATAEDEPDEPPIESGDDPPPLVSHVLVVREPVPFAPARVAVLDESARTVTRLVPLPADPGDDLELAPTVDAAPFHDWAVDRGLLFEPVLEPFPDEHYEPLPEVPKQWDGRPAPLYWRLLRLRYVRPNGWLRALFFEGSVAVAVVLVLAEAASVWTIVVLPIVVAAIVKANDVLAGNLRRNLGSTGGAGPPEES